MFEFCESFLKSILTSQNLQIFLKGMQCTICKNWGHTGKVCPNSDEVKKMKLEGRMHCYFCGKHGHTHPECPKLRLWQIRTGGQQEMEHLLKLGINSSISINV
jgi:hypothetical protein